MSLEMERASVSLNRRALIRRGHHVVTSPAELVDVDTRHDLEELRKLYGLPTDGK